MQRKVAVSLATSNGAGTGTEEPAARGAGEALADPMRGKMERAFNADFSSVRVHQGDHVAGAGAVAYTQGADIHFAPGQYDPSSSRGQELLGHELAHVVQQSRGDVTPTTQAKGLAVNDDASLERQADEEGALAARGEIVQGQGPITARAGASRPAQRKLGVSIISDDHGADPTIVRINEIQIAGRPEHQTFKRHRGGRTEGDHTTAWSVMRLAVTNRLSGKTLVQAADELVQLHEEARALPGAQTDRLDEMDVGRKQLAEKANQDLFGYSLALQGPPTRNEATLFQSTLQQAIGAYLTYRNAMGLTVMNLDGAKGDGEKNPLKLIQYWEHNWSDDHEPACTDDNDEALDIALALSRLFSPKVKGALSYATPETLPGIKKVEAPADTENALLEQFVASLLSAFPNVMRRLLNRDISVNEIIGRIGQRGWPLRPPDPEIVTGHASAVQLELDQIGTITAVHCSERAPETKMFDGLTGDHTTAYVLSASAIERALRNQTLANGKTNLDDVMTAFMALPGASDHRVKNMSDQRIVHFVKACNELEAARRVADESLTLSTIQRYAGALLDYRNSIGLTVVESGDTSRGNAEATSIDGLLAIEDELRRNVACASSRVLQKVARLFDRGALEKYSEATSKESEVKDDPDGQKALDDVDLMQIEETDDLPGSNAYGRSYNVRRESYPGFRSGESAESVIAAVLVQHLRSVRLVAPTVVATLTADRVLRMIRRYLNSENMVVPDAMGTAIAAAVPLNGALAGLVNDDDTAPPPPTKTIGKRKWNGKDETSYVENVDNVGERDQPLRKKRKVVRLVEEL